MTRVCPELRKIKEAARDLLNPTKELTDQGDNCTLMLLSNVREPEWIPVDCEENLLHFSICKSKKNVNGIYNVQDLYFCKSTNLLVNNKCYILLWNNNWKTTQFCNKYQARGITMKELYHIFDAVFSVESFPTVTVQNHDQLYVIKIQKLFDRIHLKHIYKQTSHKSGYGICTYKRSKIRIGTNLFPCKKGGHILHKYVCDENIDCPNDSSDEDICICDQIYEDIMERKLCKVLKINRTITYCTTNYYVGRKGSCEKYHLDVLSDSTEYQGLFKTFFCDHCKSQNSLSVYDNIQNCRMKTQDNFCYP